jgi:hypothetical protein
MKTAVEWLEEFMNNDKQKSEGIISLAFAKAKEMEKEQIEKALLTGLVHWNVEKPISEYYKETFKSE